MEVLRSHNVFVTTSQPQSGSSREAVFRMPQGVMACEAGQQLRVSLVSFSWPHSSWYGVNEDSQCLFLAVKDGASRYFWAPVIIDKGSYHSFQNVDYGLCDKIKDAIADGLANLVAVGAPTPAPNITIESVEYDRPRQLAKYTWTGLGVGVEVKLVCFAVTPGEEVANPIASAMLADATPQRRFSSAWEIVGGIPQTADGLQTNSGNDADWMALLSCTDSSSAPEQFGIIPMRFTYLENIYVRTSGSLPNSNWQAADFSNGAGRLPTFQPSSILAKIHINDTDDSNYSNPDDGAAQQLADRGRRVVYWSDGGSGQWSMVLPIQSVNQMTLSLTDEHGRPIPPIATVADHFTGAQMVLRVEVLG